MKTTIKQFTEVLLTVIFLVALNINVEGSAIKVISTENYETTLQVENWMTEATSWNSNSIKFTEFAHEKEPSLEIENWMVNTETWNLNDDEVESTVVLEDWMIENANWNSDESDIESSLNLEPWMISDKYWK